MSWYFATSICHHLISMNRYSKNEKDSTVQRELEKNTQNIYKKKIQAQMLVDEKIFLPIYRTYKFQIILIFYYNNEDIRL